METARMSNLDHIIKQIKERSDYDVWENFTGGESRRLITIPFAIEQNCDEFYQPNCHTFYYRRGVETIYPIESDSVRIKILLKFIRNNRSLQLKDTQFGVYLEEILRIYQIK